MDLPRGAPGPAERAGADVDVDVVVVGAGIAGCALAWALAQDGRRVMVVERDLAPPDTFRGELLQPGGLRKLQELGLGRCTEGIDAQNCRGYVVYKPATQAGKAVAHGSRSNPASAGAVASAHDHVVIPYPAEAYPDHSEQVACGRSFHHGRLVERLRQEIVVNPRISIVEGTVTELVEDAVDPAVISGIRYKSRTDAALQTVRAALTADCSGSFSKFRPQLSMATPECRSHFVALLLRGVELPYADFGYVTLADPAPVLMYAIGTGELRVLVSVPDPLPSTSDGALQRYLDEHVAPQLPSFMTAAFRSAVVERVRSVPCRTMPACAVRRPGVITVGDAMNMRHPLTGGGMTVALTDAALLASLLRPVANLADTGAVVRAVEPFFAARSNTASTINILAQVLYDVFCGGNVLPALAPVREACFDYFPHFGTDCLALVSGLAPSPLRLVGHFFAVAAFAVYRILAPIPTLGALWNAIGAFAAAYKVIQGPLYQHFVHPQQVSYQARRSPPGTR